LVVIRRSFRGFSNRLRFVFMPGFLDQGRGRRSQ
jgi:hypothetical protein